MPPAHREAAEARQPGDLGRRHAADHRVAGLAARFEGRADGADMIVHEQHGDDDDVGAEDVGLAALQRRMVLAPARRGVERQAQPRQVAAQQRLRPQCRAREMVIEGHHHDTDGDGVSGRNALWHHTRSPP